MPTTATPAPAAGSAHATYTAYATRAATGVMEHLEGRPEPRLNAHLLPLLAEADLLDSPATWGSVTTPAGAFRLEPVRPGRDLELLTGWMNDPEVAAYWELAALPRSPPRTCGRSSTATAGASPASVFSTAGR